MRRFIHVALAAMLILAGCSVEYQPEEFGTYSGDYEAVADPDGPQPSETLPDQPDFYEELRERGSLIVAAFDFDEFSVWLAGTPQYSFNSISNAYLLHALRPMTVAVVRNIDGQYTLVEEAELDFSIQPYDLHIQQRPDGIQDLLPRLGNQHLMQRDGYRISDLEAGIFRGGPVVTVHTDELMILVYSGARHEMVGPIRQFRFTRDGIIADHTLDTISNQPRTLLHELEGLAFSPQAGVLTLANEVYELRAGADGITETTQTAEIELLVEGSLTRIDGRLLGSTPYDFRDALPMGPAVLTGVRFPIISSRMYDVPPWLPPSLRESTELRLDGFDLATGEHIRDRLVHDFSPEIILHHSFAASGLTVYTTAAIYLFGHDFELVHRLPWPEHIAAEDMLERWNIHDIAFNDDFTKLAFAAALDGVHGIYLLDLAAGTPPTLLKEQAPARFGEWAHRDDIMEWPRPISLLDNDRLLISVGHWVGVDLFRIIDFDGNILNEFPFHPSAAYGGGYAFVNTAMVIFEPASFEHGPHYFDFEEGILHPAGWWERPEDWVRAEDDYTGPWLDYPEDAWLGEDGSWMRGSDGFWVRSENNSSEQWTAYIPDPNNPRIWYVSSMRHRERQYGASSELRSYILRVDFEGKTIEPLLAMAEVGITLMAVSPDGEFVFAYSGLAGEGFAVFALS